MLLDYFWIVVCFYQLSVLSFWLHPLIIIIIIMPLCLFMFNRNEDNGLVGVTDNDYITEDNKM